MLRLAHVSKSFGGLTALSDVSLDVAEGAIFGIIGPNGAGKSTLFNVVTGLARPDLGRVFLGERDVTGLAPSVIAAAGIARTFQNLRLFPRLSVRENVLVVADARYGPGVARALFGTRLRRVKESVDASTADELLATLDLTGFADDAPTSLSYGDQRRVEIARALMLSPRVLLLDEPAAGMNATEAEELAQRVRWIRQRFSCTIVLVEHNMPLVMSVCDRVHVLDHGRTVAEGTPVDVQRDPRVIAAYLGDEGEGS